MTAQDSGLSSQQASENIQKYGTNEIRSQKLSPVSIFIRQFKGNYLVYILIICTLVSFFLGQRASSIYIFAMILLSSVLGFWNEYSAQKIVDTLLKRITPRALIKRDGNWQEILITQITVGEVVMFSTGSVIPADIRVLKGENLEVNESVLTGESIPVHKTADDEIYMGTNVESGHGEGIVTEIGESTKYGKIARNLSFLKPETSFQIGLRSFGNLLVRIIFILTGAIFLVNYGLGKDWLTSLMFALAVAVGLTPELLPVVVTLSLSHGAGKLYKKHVVVKQLVAVENLGNMDVLCSDKTGTLTEGKIRLTDYFNVPGKKDPLILKNAYLSCPKVVHSSQFQSSIDSAIAEEADKTGLVKSLGTVEILDTEPFDYNKKASFNVIKFEGEKRIFVKGVYEEVSKMCSAQLPPEFSKKVQQMSDLGYRVVALAQRTLNTEISEYTWDHAVDLELTGALVFLDTPKKDAKKALEKLEKLNVEIKVLTGDNESVALKICSEVGLAVKGVLVGSQIDKMTDKELQHSVAVNNLFARVTPENKLAVITALQKVGHTVGFLGDGINDAPALHTADVGISVDGGSDVAKQAASVVLMKRGLDVITEGVMEGRRIFNNTVKYILMGTSSNFGNMFSASVASFVLPFLPMTPLQILLNNTLYDFSQLTIPSDNVDPESLLKPRHWDLKFIKKYMLFFGPISSVFDFLTFFTLMWAFGYKDNHFQAGWFLESLMTQVLVIFAIRTAKSPFFKSTPSRQLIFSSVIVLGVAVALILTPLRSVFGFGDLKPLFFVFLSLVLICYMSLVDLLKIQFIRRFKVWN